MLCEEDEGDWEGQIFMIRLVLLNCAGGEILIWRQAESVEDQPIWKVLRTLVYASPVFSSSFPCFISCLVKLQNVAVRIELIVEVSSHSYPVKVDEVI